MHSEIKHIASALLATVLIPVSYVVLFYGLFKMIFTINVEGIAISLLGVIIGVTGVIFSE